MALDDDNLDSFARKCAAAYCKRFANWNQFDDAVQNAAIFLLEHRDKWQKPPAVLFRRTVGQLIRNYQDERKLRTKNPIRIVSGDVDRATAKNETDEIDDRLDSGGPSADDRRWSIIERAIQQPELVGKREIVRAIAAGKSNAEIAAAFNLSPGRISQIFAEFKTVCQRLALRPGLIDTKRIDPTPAERNETPLFFD